MLFCGEGDNCIAAELLLWSRDEHWTTSGKIVLRFTSFEGILSACNYNSFFFVLLGRVWLVSYYSGLMFGQAAIILVIVKLNESDYVVRFGVPLIAGFFYIFNPGCDYSSALLYTIF